MTRSCRQRAVNPCSAPGASRGRNIRRFPPAVVGVLAVLVLAAGSALVSAADAPGAPIAVGDELASAKAPSLGTAQVLGVQVFIDPKTGRMRTPTPAEAAALSEAMKEFMAKFSAPQAVQTEPKVLENGTVVLALDPSLVNFSVVHLGPDGSPSQHCVKGHDHAVDITRQTSTTDISLVAEE